MKTRSGDGQAEKSGINSFPIKCPSQGMRTRYRFFWLLAHVVMTCLYGLRILHADRIPSRGPCLIVANHQSFLDPILVSLACSRREFAYLARNTLWGKYRLWHRMLALLNCIPLDTEKSDMKAIRAGLEVLKRGGVLVVFPEGARSFDGRLQEFKPGAGVLVKRAGCPVLPVAVEGAFDAFPRTSKLPRILGCRVAVSVGKPLEPDELLKDGLKPAMQHLAENIEELRLEARLHLRSATRGQFPVARLADHPMNLFLQETE